MQGLGFTAQMYVGEVRGGESEEALMPYISLFIQIWKTTQTIYQATEWKDEIQICSLKKWKL